MESCPHEVRVRSLESRTDELHDYFKKMEDKFDAKLDLILMQLNKVSLLEEKHTYQSAALSRAFDQIKEVQEDCTDLNMFKNHIEGMARMAWLIWSAMGLSLVGIIVKVFG